MVASEHKKAILFTVPGLPKAQARPRSAGWSRGRKMYDPSAKEKAKVKELLIEMMADSGLTMLSGETSLSPSPSLSLYHVDMAL